MLANYILNECYKYEQATQATPASTSLAVDGVAPPLANSPPLAAVCSPLFVATLAILVAFGSRNWLSNFEFQKYSATGVGPRLSTLELLKIPTPDGPRPSTLKFQNSWYPMFLDPRNQSKNNSSKTPCDPRHFDAFNN